MRGCLIAPPRPSAFWGAGLGGSDGDWLMCCVLERGLVERRAACLMPGVDDGRVEG
jgi:hypothetical protein